MASSYSFVLHSCAVQPQPAKRHPSRGQVACVVCSHRLFQQTSTVELPSIAFMLHVGVWNECLQVLHARVP